MSRAKVSYYSVAHAVQLEKDGQKVILTSRSELEQVCIALYNTAHLVWPKGGICGNAKKNDRATRRR